MAEYVYIANTAQVKKFLEKIQTVGVPDKLSYKQLQSMGFKSSNDRLLLGIMKALGFVSQDGTPTDRWQQYRNSETAPAALAQGIREHYADLFKLYRDADQKDNEALRNFFGTHTKVSATTLDFVVRTFKVLCDKADFKVEPPTPITPAVDQAAAKGGTSTNPPAIKVGPECTVNINIQLALPSDAKPEMLEALFQAMRKYLRD